MRVAISLAIAAVAAVVATSRAEIEAPPAPLTADSLPSPAGPGSAQPNLTVARNGHVYLSWHEPKDSGSALKLAVFDGKGWSEARTIRWGRDFFVNWADFPSVLALDDGRIAAHWLQRTGSGTYAYGVRIAMSKDQGRTWSAPITPHSDTANTEHGFVSLWSEGVSLRAAWLDGRKFPTAKTAAEREMMVMRGTINPDGTKAADSPIDQRACDCCQTSAAMTSKGPIIAYRDRSPDEIRDIYVARRIDRAGSSEWVEPVPVHRDGWKVTYCPVNGPNVSANGERVALAWFTAPNDSARVKLAFSSNAGETFGAPIRIDEGNPTGRVDVELLRNGDALVTWVERLGGDTAAVRMRRVQSNGKASAAMTIASSSSARTSGFPRMAITGDNVMFAWTSPGRPSHVRIARMPLSKVR